MGAGGLYFRVRDGTGCFPAAIVTKRLFTNFNCALEQLNTLSTEQNAHTSILILKIKSSTVSTGWLNTLLRLHLPPIQLVVFQRSYPVSPVGDLILGRASHLDAFSGYLCQT